MIYWVNQYAVSLDQPGGTRHFEFAARLARDGHRVTLVASDFNHRALRFTRRSGESDRILYRDRLEGFDVDWLYTLPYTQNDRRRALSMLTFSGAVFDHLLRCPVQPGDVFVGSSPHLFAALATWLAARIKRVPFILEVRDLWPESIEEVLGRKTPTTRALNVVANHLYRAASRIIVLARGTREALIKRGVSSDKLIYVPNSIDPSRFDGLPTRRESRTRFDLPQDRFVAVYAGAHGPANHLETLVEAGEILARDEREDILILLIGDGPTKPKLAERVRAAGVRTVLLRDPIPKTDVPALLAACDVGLMHLKDVPLFRYGVSPNKLFDYLAARLPVLDTVQGECAQIVNDAGAGVVVPPEDASAVAAGLVRLAEMSKDERRALGEGGRRYVEQHFNRETLAHRLADGFTSR